MQIRILTLEDWKVWKSLRLEALQNAPENFGSSYEEELHYPDSNFQEWLSSSDIFGAFMENELVSCAGFYCLNSLKTKHRGVIWGMYTRPEYRGQGIASALMRDVIKHSTSKVSQVHLTCATSNIGALNLYKKHGFEVYGTEPRSLKINDTFCDEHLMILNFAL